MFLRLVVYVKAYTMMIKKKSRQLNELFSISTLLQKRKAFATTVDFANNNNNNTYNNNNKMQKS